MRWRYHAFRLNGDGTETPLAWDLPLQDVGVQQAINGQGGIDAKISPEVARMVTGHGEPVLVPWSTAIYAEASGRIHGAGIVDDLDADGPALTINCRGFTGYLAGMPYYGDLSVVQTDPLDIVRRIWRDQQAFKRGNLGMTVATTKSTVKVGEQQESKGGPYQLSWWKTDDLGKEIDDLATSTPFEYREAHSWSGERVAHKLELGAPRLGGRRTDLRFVVGENVKPAKLEWQGEDYADEILLLGSGEGRKMIRGSAQRQTDRLRRPRVVQDKKVTDLKRAAQLAEAQLKFALGDVDTQEFTVRNHPNAPIGSWAVGDDVFFQSRGDWHDSVSLWMRVLSQTITPERDEVTVRVARSDKAVA